MKIIWAIFEKIGIDLIQASVFLIFAKLLGPEAFGVVGVLTIFVTISKSIIEGGFKDIIVRNRDISSETISAIFIFQLFIAFLLYIVLYFTAPEIGSYFDDKRLTPLLRILSVSLILNSMSIVHSSSIYKYEDYKTLSKIRGFSIFLAAVIGVVHALIYSSFWSIVVYHIGLSLFSLILNFYYTYVKMSWPKFNHEFLKALQLGYKLLVSSLLNANFHNVLKFIIGSKFSMEFVGFFSQTVRLSQLVVRTPSNFIGRYSFPIFSKKRDFGFVISLLRVGVLYFLTVQIGVLYFGSNVVIYLLGDKWLFITEGLVLLLSFGYLFYNTVLVINCMKILTDGKVILYNRFVSFSLPLALILVVDINYINVLMLIGLSSSLSFIICLRWLSKLVPIGVILEIIFNSIILVSLGVSYLVNYHVLSTILIVISIVLVSRILLITKLKFRYG
jgi:teichuronic acid exporter